MKIIIKPLLFAAHLILSVLLVYAVAQDDGRSDTTTEAEQNRDANAQDEPKARPETGSNSSTSRNTQPSEQVFKPTEEISEDSPVPFPVDI